MYIIVNFESDNSIEVVPYTWLKSNLCAWPRDGKKAKNLIVRKMIPNEFDFKMTTARQIGGRTYGSYHEAKAKLNLALETSDLSTTEDELRTRKICKNKTPSPQIKKFRKMNLPKPPVLHSNNFVRKHSADSDLEDEKDEDKDPDYRHTADNVAIAGSSKVSNWSGSSEFENVTTCMVSNARKELFSGNPQWNDDLPCSSNYIKPTSNQEPTNMKNVFDEVISKQNIHNNENTLSSKNIENLDSSTLTCIKYDLKCQAYKIDALTSICQSIFDKLDNSRDSQRNNFESFEESILESLYDIWPLSNNEDLLSFEKLLEDSKKRKAYVAILARMTVRNINESVRAIMKRMFSDGLLSNNSFIGFKGKSSFSILGSCLLVFDAIRKAPRFKDSTDDLILTLLKQWLAQAPARLSKKEAKQIAKNNNSEDDMF